MDGETHETWTSHLRRALEHTVALGLLACDRIEFCLDTSNRQSK